jgi:hypothetical protein
MAAPSRTESLGMPVPNPHDLRFDNERLTEYELLQEKKKARLHAEVQLALVTQGVLLDERVLQGFDGKVPSKLESTAQNEIP